MAIPITAEAAEAINAAAPPDHVTFLLDEHGRAFTAKGFSKWFSGRCRDIGLKGLSAHGLRKAACRRLAEPGCTVHEIAAVSGHESLKEVERYTRAAEQARMARNAMSRMDREHRVSNLPSASGKPGQKGR